MRIAGSARPNGTSPTNLMPIEITGVGRGSAARTQTAKRVLGGKPPPDPRKIARRRRFRMGRASARFDEPGSICPTPEDGSGHASPRVPLDHSRRQSHAGCQLKDTSWPRIPLGESLSPQAMAGDNPVNAAGNHVEPEGCCHDRHDPGEGLSTPGSIPGSPRTARQTP